MFKFAHITTTALGAILLTTCVSAKLNLRFPFGSTQVRGVNLGGWLLLEPFITPSLFDSTGNTSVVDEYTYGENAKKKASLKTALTNHWNTFYTESDFAAIAAAGLNHVRIPIGYWAFDAPSNEPYVTGGYPYLLKAVQWSANHDLNVLIDIHGLPGSQNGFDNSGHRGAIHWADKQSYLDRTDAIIKTLAAEFSKSQYANVVSSIAPVNEPYGKVNSAVLTATKNLFQKSYSTLRNPFSNGTTGNVALVIGEAFMGLDYWNGYMPSPQYEGVVMDKHTYGVFTTSQLKQTWGQHISAQCSVGTQVAKFQKSNLPTIVGEWSLATTDCAKYLLGRGRGSRYDGSDPGSSYIGSCTGKSGSGANFVAKYKVFLRKFFEAQTSAYERGSGWIYWAWKAENADEWSYQAGLKYGWIPQTPSEKIYGNQCGF